MTEPPESARDDKYQEKALKVENSAKKTLVPRVVGGSLRPDGSVRKVLQLRPGFVPSEEVPRYVNPRRRQLDGLDALTTSMGRLSVAGVAQSTSDRSHTKAAPKSADHTSKNKGKLYVPPWKRAQNSPSTQL